MAENKKDNEKEDIVEENEKEKVEENKTDVENEEVEEITETEAEVVEEVVEEKPEKSSKFLIHIVAIVLIVITAILGLVLIFVKPSPKKAAEDFFELSLKNPIEAVVKYSVSEFDLKVEKEKGKFTTYKVTKVEDIEEEDGKEIAKVHYTVKGPNTYKIMQEVEENLEERKIEEGSAKYNKEYLKELNKLLKEKKDQLEEVEDTLILVRNKGERNWTISTSIF